MQSGEPKGGPAEESGVSSTLGCSSPVGSQKFPQTDGRHTERGCLWNRLWHWDFESEPEHRELHLCPHDRRAVHIQQPANVQNGLEDDTPEQPTCPQCDTVLLGLARPCGAPAADMPRGPEVASWTVTREDVLEAFTSTLWLPDTGIPRTARRRM